MGITIVKDELTPLLEQMKKGMQNPPWAAILEQAKSDNDRLFDSEKGADDDGVVKDWITWNMGKGHIPGGTTQVKGTGVRWKWPQGGIWKRRHSNKRFYSAESKLLQDDSTLRKSIGSKGEGGIYKTTREGAEFGTALDYAIRQHGMRPIVSVTSETMKKILRLITKLMGLED